MVNGIQEGLNLVYLWLCMDSRLIPLLTLPPFCFVGLRAVWPWCDCMCVSVYSLSKQKHILPFDFRTVKPSLEPAQYMNSTQGKWGLHTLVFREPNIPMNCLLKSAKTPHLNEKYFATNVFFFLFSKFGHIVFIGFTTRLKAGRFFSISIHGDSKTTTNFCLIFLLSRMGLIKYEGQFLCQKSAKK